MGNLQQEKAGQKTDTKPLQSSSEAKVPSTSYDKIAELAYDAEMKHEGDTHQIFFDLLDQGTQKNHINLGTGSALKAGRKYNDSIGTVNVTVGDSKDSGKKLSFTDANALDKAILDALPYVSTVKYFQSQYPGTKAYKKGGKAAKNLYASTVTNLKALSGTITDGKNSATAKFTGKMGYVNVFLSDEDVAQVKKVNIDADFNFGDNVTAVFKKCLTKEEDAQNVVFKGFIHGIHAYGSMPTVYKHFGKDANNLRILEDAVKKNEGTDDLVKALYKSIEATLSTKWHEPFKTVINTYIKGKGKNSGGSSASTQSSKTSANSGKTTTNSGKVAGNSGSGAKGGLQMNEEGHPIYYPKGAQDTLDRIKWNKDRNYTTTYIKSFQKLIKTDDDGSIGTNTVNAIRHYQEKNSSIPSKDGKWGKECADASGLVRQYNGNSGGSTAATTKSDKEALATEAQLNDATAKTLGSTAASTAQSLMAKYNVPYTGKPEGGFYRTLANKPKHYVASRKYVGEYCQAQRHDEARFYDCSAFTNHCWRDAGGYNFKRACAAEQARVLYNAKAGITKANVQAGDLLFYASSKPNKRFKNISHVAIAVSNSERVDAGWTPVTQKSIDNPIFIGRPGLLK